MTSSWLQCLGQAQRVWWPYASTHSALVTAYGVQNMGQHWSRLPNDTKPLPQPIQCWLIISEVLWHSLEDDFIGSTQDGSYWICFKTNYLILQPDLLGTNELTGQATGPTDIRDSRLVITVPADGLAPSGARPSAGTVVTTTLAKRSFKFLSAGDHDILLPFGDLTTSFKMADEIVRNLAALRVLKGSSSL